MMVLSVLALVAIVTQDQTALRASPSDSAPQQAVLWQGDALEVRGEKRDYLQVWDHRRERAGYIKNTQVRTTTLSADNAGELLSVLRFLRDTSGAEALGIGYAAAYLRAVPADQLGAEAFDALGTMADRLAKRASARSLAATAATLAAHLEVANYYGVRITSTGRDGAPQLCYDGEAFGYVLAMASLPEQRARAALGLTRHDCHNTDPTPAQRQTMDEWRAQVLDQVTPDQFMTLPETLKNRLRLRRAGVWSSLAFQQARRSQPAAASAQRALQELAGVNKAELTDSDRTEYTEAAIRVGASRWAAEPEPSPAKAPGLNVLATPGRPGETCVSLVDTRSKTSAPLAQRCTYGLVWMASARPHANGSALALAVQPLDTWRELWLFRRDGKNWVIHVIPPVANGPALGYIEFAGWVPGQTRVLLARESKVEGRTKRSFEVLRMDTLVPERSASAPGQLRAFQRWQDPAWKRQTVSVR